MLRLTIFSSLFLNVLTPTAFALESKFGGTPFQTGPFTLEVFAQPDNHKVLAVFAGNNAPHVEPQSLKVSVTLHCQSGKNESVALRWEGKDHEFAGTFDCPQPALGPMTVTVLDGKRVFRAYEPLVPPVPVPRYGGYVMVAGPYVFEVVPWSFGSVEVIPRDTLTFQSAEGLDVSVDVQTKELSQPLTVPMAWQSYRHRFGGKVNGKFFLRAGKIKLDVREKCAAGLRTFEGSVALTTPLSAAQMKGFQVSTGAYTVEIAPKQNGYVEAVVLDQTGNKPSATAIQLIVDALDDKGNVYPLAMNYYPTQGKYMGWLKARPENIVSYFAKVRAGDAVGADPYRTMYNITGRVRAKGIDGEFKNAQASPLHKHACQAKSTPKGTVNSDMEYERSGNDKK